LNDIRLRPEQTPAEVRTLLVPLEQA
jgi:hypothetical protein